MRIVKRKQLRGAAADAALRLLSKKDQRTVNLVARLCGIPLRRAIRLLVHKYRGDVEEFRNDAIYDLVTNARRDPKRPQHQRRESDVALAERVVGERLIRTDREFKEYLADVHLAITGSEKVL